MKYGLAYQQAFELQQDIYKAALDPAATRTEKAQLVRAWDQLEDRKRIIRGRPLPGSRRPESAKPKKRGISGLNPL